MVSKVILILIVALWVAESEAKNKVADCIKQQLATDIGPGYNEEYEELKSTQIPRIKQALQSVYKNEGVVKTESNGQMTILKDKWAEYANQLGNKPTGRAMDACSKEPDADRMYQEAARGPQCVFKHLKEKCQK